MRRTFNFLPLILVLGLTGAARSEEPQGDKTAGTVDVRLTEYAVEMPGTLPAGPTTFLVHNQGQKRHSFKIEGPGVDQMLEAIVSPQQTGSLQVTLQPGEYKVYCPIGSHSAKGMTMKLVVTAKQQGG
jgi:plastocyanin